jgi:16S rRNA processing protein RimM
VSRKNPVQQPSSPAGSPVEGEPAFVVVGKLRHAHGLQGELLLEVWTDFPERLRPGMLVYTGAERQPRKMLTRRQHNLGMLVMLEGLDTPEEAGKLRNQLVYLQTSQIPPLPDGEFYHHELIGMRVVNEAGVELGTIAEILETGANDVLVVRRENGGEILIPVIDEIVLKIDTGAKVMLIHQMDGLVSDPGQADRTNPPG